MTRTVDAGLSYAQATRQPSHPSTRERNTTRFEPDPLPRNNNTSYERPAWVDELKRELASLVSTQIISLADQVKSNTEKINFLLTSIYPDHQ